MTQPPLDLFSDRVEIQNEAESLIARFREVRQQSNDARSTIDAEVSQLRSLARDAQCKGLTLDSLLREPHHAAQLIEAVGARRSQATLLTRSRAFQKLLLMALGAEAGRSQIERFRANVPHRASKGWHDSGISTPGAKSMSQSRLPTPDINALLSIFEAGASRSQLDGAIAGLACFSGLELDEISKMRWKDVTWQDQTGTPFCEIRVHRGEHKTTCVVVADGAKALLSYALASGLERDAYVFPGRVEGEALSTGAVSNRLRAACGAAGWKGLTRSQLTSGFVLWLSNEGFDDHSIRIALGRRRVATIDRLLRSANSIASQRFMDGAMTDLH